jgi:transcriptional regulator with XRE-family HTH domain
MELSLQAQVSARHLSWLETGRAEPSRAMVLRLAQHLEVPLRDRNTLLASAGFAPLYPERGFAAPDMAHLRQSVQRLLDAHEPWPSLAVDRHWNLVAHNRMVPLLLKGVAPELLAPPINMLRLSLHPQGLAPQVLNLSVWRAQVLARLQQQALHSGDPVLGALLNELSALPGPRLQGGTDDGPQDHGLPADIAVPLSLASPYGPLNFVTTVTVFGAPHDVTLSELAVETLLPADPASAETLRRLQADAG